MAGRKTPPKQDLFSMLLGKIGLVPAKKGKKGKRRKNGGRPRPRPAEDAYAEGYANPYGEHTVSYDESVSDYGAGESYEAAAAAGYAPSNPLFPDLHAEASADALPALPNFYGPGAPGGGTGPLGAAAVVPPPAASEPPEGRLFSEEALDNSLDALFSGLESGNLSFASEPAEPVSAVAPPAPIVHAPIAPPVAPPPVATPPLPPRPITGPLTATPASGPLPAPTVWVLSQGTDLRALLATIDRVPGVAGSLLVGLDGLTIISSLGPEFDREFLGAQACSLFTENALQMSQLGRGELRRLMLETKEGAMLMTAADMGILVIVSQNGQAMDAGAILAAISGALGRA